MEYLVSSRRPTFRELTGSFEETVPHLRELTGSFTEPIKFINTLYSIVIPTIRRVLDVLAQQQLHYAPYHRLKSSDLPHFPPSHYPLPFPLSLE